MSSDDKTAEIALEGAPSNKRAKSSPTLFGLFEKMFDILKKYW